MKILFYSWEFGPGTGGIGQYLFQMAQGLHAMGHETIVVAGKNGLPAGCDKQSYGVVYRIYGKKQVRSAVICEKVLDIAKKHKVDLIEGTDHWGECAGVIKRSDRPRVLIKYHGCQVLKALTSAQTIYPWQKLMVALALLRIRRQIKAEKTCVEKPDLAIAPSMKIMTQFQKQGVILPSNRAVIPNILSHIPEVREQEESKNPNLLFVGRVEIGKGIQYLPSILNAVQRRFPGVVLEIAGNDTYARGLGSMKKWLSRQFGEQGKNVRFLGGLSAKELDQAYRRAWVIIFPTKWDNFPMAVLEAMAHAKPVITTENGGMPEMLAGTGAPIEDPSTQRFSEAVISLLQDAERRKRIGWAQREKVIREYIPEVVVPSYLEFVKAHL